MALTLPSSLSPSKLTAFKECALAFRFSAIDKLPEPTSPHALQGTLVHRALERLFWHHAPGNRAPETAFAELDAAWDELRVDSELEDLGLGDGKRADFLEQARGSVRNLYALEDPDTIVVAGVELLLDANLDGVRFRGIIDRLDVTGDDLVVVDYKTGRVPAQGHEQSRLTGVNFYALLLEVLLGRAPSKVQLFYLREPVIVESEPSKQSLRAFRQRAAAVWSAIEHACETEDFRPRPSGLCPFCSFREYCPAVGGDLGLVTGAAAR
jgi:putative RecB family exonuclease